MSSHTARRPRSRVRRRPERRYDWIVLHRTLRRRRAQGKKHDAAHTCLARRRVDVLHAMRRTGTLYEAKTPSAA